MTLYDRSLTMAAATEILGRRAMARLVIDEVLDDYAASLGPVERRKQGKITADHVLTVLLVRDEVQRSIAAESHGLAAVEVRRLIGLDGRLRNCEGRMVRVVGERELGRWRSTVNVEEKAWWWWLERVAGEHPLNRLDELWRLLMVAGWAANITLMVNLAARFLGGGVGLAGVAAVAVPSVLGVLQIGSEFTKEGKEGPVKCSSSKNLGWVRLEQNMRRRRGD